MVRPSTGALLYAYAGPRPLLTDGWTVMRVFVTGGLGFTGAALVARLLERGHSVAVLDKNPGLRKEEIETAGADVTLGSVTDREAVQPAVQRILDEAGAIDVLVNNAGVTAVGALEDIDESDIERVMQTNFFGPVWLTRAVLPQMRAQGGGHIVMVSSLSALVGLPGESIYAASKAALELAAEGLRHEVDRFNIHVSVVQPGLFNTRMPEKIAAASAYPSASAYSELIAFLVERMQRNLGSGDDPQKVAELIVRIAGEQTPEFRYPAGAQAERVVEKLGELRESDRSSFIQAVHGTAWWSDGDAPPSEKQ